MKEATLLVIRCVDWVGCCLVDSYLFLLGLHDLVLHSKIEKGRITKCELLPGVEIPHPPEKIVRFVMDQHRPLLFATYVEEMNVKLKVLGLYSTVFAPFKSSLIVS